MLTRLGGDELPTYRVEVFLPEQRKLESMLRWDEGQPRLDPDLSDPWARDEALKLARVLKRTPKAVLSRWRG